MKQALGNVDWVSILDTLDANDAWLLFKVIFQGIMFPFTKTKEKFVL